MKTILALLLLLSPVASLAQSPFDGTWIIDTSTNQPPQKLTLYSLAKGQFRGPDWTTSVKADGNDQQVPANGYWDTISVRIVDDHTVEARVGSQAEVVKWLLGTGLDMAP